MKMHRIFLILIFSLSYCSTTSLKENLMKDSSITRVFIQYKTDLEDNSLKLLKDIVSEQLSHHTEFIVYDTINSCDDLNKEKTGFFLVTLNEIIENEKIKLSFETKIIRCEDKKVSFETSFNKTYKILESNTEFIENYKSKFGDEIGIKVKPYLDSIRKLFKKVPAIKLTDEEIEEKIEIEST